MSSFRSLMFFLLKLVKNKVKWKKYWRLPDLQNEKINKWKITRSIAKELYKKKFQSGQKTREKATNFSLIFLSSAWFLDSIIISYHTHKPFILRDKRKKIVAYTLKSDIKCLQIYKYIKKIRETWEDKFTQMIRMIFLRNNSWKKKLFFLQ